MTYSEIPESLPAPCIIGTGTVVNKHDMRRLLGDLGRVHYRHVLEGSLEEEGDGYVVEVFADALQATLVVNRALYINVQCFDYLEISQTPDGATVFDLVQDNRQLSLTPQSTVLHERALEHSLDTAAIEVMVAQVLSARRDAQLDEDGYAF
ncbi:hypothetical protein KR51_00004420 [Rubidibacter lacunae KORDI 51-2]|uniref:Uncharacterized protein n=1 Tax=Rubidibacter lacunae KORDI 51-2 TaxID=582515 RepID=U5DE85_9CHRO|nr:hypothetical protein [Rubidibacter lacunae]ERN42823.1 hypothetical protein KR51_00004420 [Rubidibacter lacunae KORDI 51-2]